MKINIENLRQKLSETLKRSGAPTFDVVLAADLVGDDAFEGVAVEVPNSQKAVIVRFDTEAKSWVVETVDFDELAPEVYEMPGLESAVGFAAGAVCDLYHL